MKKIDETKFDSYVIVRNGSKITLFSLSTVLKAWKEYGPGSSLYGNRKDGKTELIESK